MILEVNMSPNDDHPAEQKKKKYLWFGYGGYAGPGEAGAFNPANIRADPKIFDWLLELFGVKEKTRKETKQDRQ
jgi:hypothetical protein